MMADRGTNGFVTSEAPTWAEVNSCIQCGLCLPYCPTFRLTGEERYSPRGRLTAMNAVITGITTVDESFDDALSTCLGCRACEAVCPGLVPYGRAYEGAMAELTAQRPNQGRRIRRVVLGRLLPSRRLVALVTIGAALVQRLRLGWLVPSALAGGFRGLRRLSGRQSTWVGNDVPAVGVQRGTVALLSGCVMDAWFGDVHAATIGILSRAGYRVIVPDAQVCCGALAAHDGQVSVARLLATRNIEALAGADYVVSNAAGCSAHLAEYDHWGADGASVADRAIDATTLVARLIDEGVLPRLPATGVRVAIQDPCHLRHAQRQMNAPRTVVRAAGHEPVEIDPDGLCCGAAGIYSLTHPETSAELGRRKAAQVRATSVDVVASANPGCEMQLRSHLGPRFQVVHPVEVYWRRLTQGHVGYAPATGPFRSET